jgi:hypothetical protein
VSTELQEAVSVTKPCALDEFRATHDGYAEFFGDVFDQLQVLSLDLFARHKSLEAGAARKSAADETLAEFREDLVRSVEKLQDLHGQCQADSEPIREIRQGLQQVAGAVAGVKEELKQVRSLLEAVAGQPGGDLAGPEERGPPMIDAAAMASVLGQLEMFKRSAYRRSKRRRESPPGETSLDV